MHSSTLETPLDLKGRWLALQKEQPKIRIRDAAQHLGVSEAELLSTSCGLGKVERLLAGDFGEIIESLPQLGSIMALTRNEGAVHEKKGCFENVKVNGDKGLVLGATIDLRLFLDNWAMAFAVREEVESGLRRSLHFFDEYGTAVHKVYLQEEGDAEAFEELILRFRSSNQEPLQPLPKPPSPAHEKGDVLIDLSDFHGAWDGLQDVHDFFAVVRRFGLTRTQALRLAGPGRARQVRRGALRQVLESASRRELDILIFVGNPGAIQIHSGPIRHVKAMGDWLNVLDSDFNLHVREDRIFSSWIVKKPTRDGIITSLELFDKAGTNLALLFGKRKPGQAESEDWRGLLKELWEGEGRTASSDQGVENGHH